MGRDSPARFFSLSRLLILTSEGLLRQMHDRGQGRYTKQAVEIFLS